MNPKCNLPFNNKLKPNAKNITNGPDKSISLILSFIFEEIGFKTNFKFFHIHLKSISNSNICF